MERGSSHDAKCSQGHPSGDTNRDRDPQTKAPNRAAGYLFGFIRNRNECRFGDGGGKANRCREYIHPIVVFPGKTSGTDKGRVGQLFGHVFAEGKQCQVETDKKQSETEQNVYYADHDLTGMT